MDRLAKHFWQLKEYYHDSRRPIEAKWRACDEAYLCYRRLPDTGAIDFLDDSEFGETDAHDNVNTIVIRMLQAILPPGMPYLNPSASDPDEPQAVTDAVRDYLIYKHRESGSRRQLAKWLKMMVVRGDGAFYWEHQEEYVRRPVLGVKSQQAIRDALLTGGIKSKEAAQFTKVMEEVCVFNGPVIRVIDTHDYFFSPITDLTNRRKEPFIVQTFRYIQELVAEEDSPGVKTYGNLSGLDGQYAYDLWNTNHDGGTRIRSMEIMGLNPETSHDSTRLVPVYICYVPYLKFEDREFFDTYFHFAVNSNGKGGKAGPRMIRVETNPTGQRQFLFDTYNEFFTNTPYGISGIEKSLSALRQKNVLAGLLFNAAVAVQFPAQNVLASVFKDGEVSFMPGAINEIDGMVDITKVMSPVPTPERGLQLGWQDMKFWGDDLRTKMGIDGLQATSATRSVSKGKTATEVNHDSSSGNLMLDEMSAKYSDTLTSFFQGSYDLMKDRVEPNEQGDLEYQRNINSRLVQDKLKMRDFQKPRSITIGFLQGIFDKGQRLAALSQAIGMVGQAAQYMPNAGGVIVDMVVEACRLMNVPIKAENLMSPQELAAANPQVQIMALQNAMQQIGAAQEQQGGGLPGGMDDGGTDV